MGVNAAFRMKTVSTLALLPLLFCLLPLPSLCTEEGIVEPHEVSIRADAGAPYGEVRVTVRTKGIHSERRISDIQLEVGSTSVRIPEKAYGDLEWPRLNTVKLLTTPSGEKGPSLFIFFELASYTPVGHEWAPKRVRIEYSAGRIVSRSIETRSPDGVLTTSWQRDKL